MTNCRWLCFLDKIAPEALPEHKRQGSFNWKRISEVLLSQHWGLDPGFVQGRYFNGRNASIQCQNPFVWAEKTCAVSTVSIFDTNLWPFSLLQSSYQLVIKRAFDDEYSLLAYGFDANWPQWRTYSHFTTNQYPTRSWRRSPYNDLPSSGPRSHHGSWVSLFGMSKKGFSSKEDRSQMDVWILVAIVI